MCLTWPLESRDGFCARVKKERGHRLGMGVCVCVWGGIIRRNRKGSAKKRHIGWVFVIASPARWMAAAAVHANSCRPEKVGKNKLRRGGGQGGANHTRAVSGCAIPRLGKRIGFIGKHICLEAHFPVCQRGVLQDRKNLGGCAVVKY